MRADDDVLSVRSVSKRFGGNIAVDGVSFDVAAGETVGVVGPNGSGKSTLLSAIAGVVSPTSGAIVLGGRNISGWPAHRAARAGVHFSFQRTRLFPEMTVAEHLLMGTADRRVLPALVRRGWANRDARLDATITTYGLGDVAAHRATALSFGQRQLLSLALADTVGARLVLLDEPFAGLSGESVDTVGQQVKRMASLGVAFLIVEHRLRSLSQLCSRYVVMDQGELLADGAPTVVMERADVVAAYFGTHR